MIFTQAENCCPIKSERDIFGGKWKVRILAAVYDFEKIELLQIVEKLKLSSIEECNVRLIVSFINELIAEGFLIFKPNIINSNQWVELTSFGLQTVEKLHVFCQWTDISVNKHEINCQMCSEV